MVSPMVNKRTKKTTRNIPGRMKKRIRGRSRRVLMIQRRRSKSTMRPRVARTIDVVASKGVSSARSSSRADFVMMLNGMIMKWIRKRIIK